MENSKKTPGVAFYGKVRIPTIGHKKAIETAQGIAKKTGGQLRIGLSGTSHPLTPETKKAHAEMVFGHPVETGTPETSNLFSYLASLGQHHDELHLVAGSDRAPEYRKTLQQWNGRADKNGKVGFNFKRWKVHEVEGKRGDSGEHPTKMSRDELERSVSATKLEKLARSGDYEGFRAYHPGMPEKHVKKVYNQIRMASSEPPKPKSVKAIKEDAVADIGELNHEKFGPMLDSFTQFASDKLGIKKSPKIHLSKKDMTNSFGGYNPADHSIVVVSKNRHPMDIFRTVAHELVHHKQKEDDRIGKDISYEGSTGSPFENEANAEAGKIMRWFAKKNPEMFKSGYVVEETLTEGINDPGTFKAVFLAGGPGSGKDYVMKQTLDGMGLQEINSDVAFEFLMKKAGLNFKMPESERVERDVARGKAKKLTKERERLALSGRRGVIINGTADDPEKIASIKKELEELGYDTMMVFVNTSDKVSKERNIARGDEGGRTVPEDIRKDKWDACQAAMPVLQKLFGKENFVAVDNSNDLRKASPEVVKKVKGEFQNIFKMTKKFVARQPINNEKAAGWQQNELQKRNMQSFTPAKATAFGSGAVQRGAMQTTPLPPDQDATQQVSQAPSPDQMSQAKRLGLTYYGFGRWGTTIKGKNTVTYLTQNGKLVPKPQQQQVAEEKKMKGPDPCWKGYQMVGKKKKNGKEVPNCVPVDEAFETFVEGEDRTNTYKRELGTKDLANLYAKDTPGQDTAHLNPLYEKKKVRFVKKKKVEEDAPPPYGYEFGNSGIGPTFGVVRSPGGLGMGYSLPLNESIKNWMLNEKTIERFIEKYGDRAEEKLYETANKLDSLYTKNDDNTKTFTEIRESWDAAGGRDMGTVPKTGKQDMDESTPAWQRKEGKNPEGGLNRTGINAYRKDHPGSKLSLAVTTKPSKLKPGSKKANRRLSFCRRMKGMKSKLTSAKTARDPNSRINKSLRKWNCEE
jgi:predicted ABC-type ATPase